MREWILAYSAEVAAGLTVVIILFGLSRKLIIEEIPKIVDRCNDRCARNIIARYRIELKKHRDKNG